MATRRFGSRLAVRGGILISGWIAMAACAGHDAVHNGGSGAGQPTGSDAANGTASGISLDGGSGTGSGNGASGGGGMNTCAATPYVAAQLPLDMYVMLDQSGSMKETTAAGPSKWSAVTSALSTFVGQPGLQGISIGIQYFGLPAGGGMVCPPFCLKDSDCGASGPCKTFQCAGCSFGSDSCNAADYAKPEVPMSALPGAATAIQASLGKHSPQSGTPTSAGLQGAVQYAEAWAAQHPEHVVIAVLATDGNPTQCDTNVGDIAAIAAAGVANKPSVKTFTIGVFAPGDIPSGPNTLTQISVAGGTGKPFVITTNDPNVNVQQEFLKALNAIRGAALGCQYSIPVPKMGIPDYTQLNVQYTPGKGPAQTIPNYPDKAHCPANGDGWYYDVPAAPKQIILCNSTCDKVAGDAKGKIDILLGCKTLAGDPK